MVARGCTTARRAGGPSGPPRSPPDGAAIRKTATAGGSPRRPRAPLRGVGLPLPLPRLDLLRELLDLRLGLRLALARLLLLARLAGEVRRAGREPAGGHGGGELRGALLHAARHLLDDRVAEQPEPDERQEHEEQRPEQRDHDEEEREGELQVLRAGRALQLAALGGNDLDLPVPRVPVVAALDLHSTSVPGHD